MTVTRDECLELSEKLRRLVIPKEIEEKTEAENMAKNASTQNIVQWLSATDSTTLVLTDIQRQALYDEGMRRLDKVVEQDE